jgi:hypothetical protein
MVGPLHELAKTTAITDKRQAQIVAPRVENNPARRLRPSVVKCRPRPGMVLLLAMAEMLKMLLSESKNYFSTKRNNFVIRNFRHLIIRRS